MNLDQVLEQMKASEPQTKTASVAAQPVSTENVLLNVLTKTAAPVSPKTASEGDAVNDLMKMASELAGTEREVEVAHAAVCGSAFADAAISKFAAYDAQVQLAVAQAGLAKTASVSAPANPNVEEMLMKAAEIGYFEAYAEMNEKTAEPQLTKEAADQLYKEAAELGYQETQVKLAAEYQAGQNDALRNVHAVAMGEFLKGAAEAEIMINRARAQVR